MPFARARPMITDEVVDGIVAELGYGADAVSGLRNRVRANLRYLEKGERVLKEGERAGGGVEVGVKALALVRTDHERVSCLWIAGVPY